MRLKFLQTSNIAGFFHGAFMAQSWVLLVLATPSSCNQCILGTFAEPGNCQTGEGLMERWHIQIEPRRLLRLSGGEQDKSGRRGGSGGRVCLMII